MHLLCIGCRGGHSTLWPKLTSSNAMNASPRPPFVGGHRVCTRGGSARFVLGAQLLGLGTGTPPAPPPSLRPHLGTKKHWASRFGPDTPIGAERLVSRTVHRGPKQRSGCHHPFPTAHPHTPAPLPSWDGHTPQPPQKGPSATLGLGGKPTSETRESTGLCLSRGRGTGSCQNVPEACQTCWGECLPGARPARYFSINYPDFSPRFTPWKLP